MAKTMFIIRQEQSPHIAQGLVINCPSRGEQGFLWLSIWSQKWLLPACTILLLKTTTFPGSEREHVYISLPFPRAQWPHITNSFKLH